MYVYIYIYECVCIIFPKEIEKPDVLGIRIVLFGIKGKVVSKKRKIYLVAI